MSELLLAEERQESREANALKPEDLYEGQISFFSRASWDGASIQQLLATAQVVVIGGGVVGSHTLASLADAGVGTLKILDSSTVERNNLAGNALLSADDLNRSRADALKERVGQRNPYTKVETLAANPDSIDDLKEVFRRSDLALVCLDSPAPAILDAVNAAALETNTRWTTGQIYSGMGLVGPTVIPNQSPCYKCYEMRRDFNLNNYEETMQYESRLREMPGIRNECMAPTPLAALVAAFIAVEALRLASRTEYPQLFGRVLHLSFFGKDFSEHRLLRFPKCSACGYGKRRSLPQFPQLPLRK